MTLKTVSLRETRILVIEDEKAIRDMIQYSFTSTDFIMLEAETVEEAKNILAQHTPQLILLDWMLPGQSGIHFIQWLKKKSEYRDIPIIMLTAKAEEESRVKGLEAGADDYVTKPFSPRELIARIKTVLRRGPLANPDGQITIGNLSLNINHHTAFVNHDSLSLTKNEYDLLYFFMTHPNRVYTRDQLIDFVWGKTTYIDERTVDVQIRRLRDKLKPYDYHHLISTIRGIGYQLISSKIHE